MRWGRTTLVLRGDTWKLLEYCQDATLLGSVEEKIPNPASVILLLTISRDDWLSPEELGLMIESLKTVEAYLNLSLLLKYRKSLELRFMVWTGRESVMIQTGSKPSILAWALGA